MAGGNSYSEGPLHGAITKGHRNDAEETLRRLTQIFSPKDLYVEIQRQRIPSEERTGDALISLAAAYGLPIKATNGVLFTESSVLFK